MDVNTSTTGGWEEREIEKLPLSSVYVPTLPPLTITDTEGTGLPVPVSVTLPLMTTDWATAATVINMHNSTAKEEVISFLIQQYYVSNINEQFE